jgi:hypothetical protein
MPVNLLFSGLPPNPKPYLLTIYIMVIQRDVHCEFKHNAQEQPNSKTFLAKPSILVTKGWLTQLL